MARPPRSGLQATSRRQGNGDTAPSLMARRGTTQQERGDGEEEGSGSLKRGRRPARPPCGHAAQARTRGWQRRASATPRRGDDHGNGQRGGGRGRPAALAAPLDQLAQPRPGITQRGPVDVHQEADGGLIRTVRGRRRRGRRAHGPANGDQCHHGDDNPGGTLAEHRHRARDGIATASPPEADSCQPGRRRKARLRSAGRRRDLPRGAWSRCERSETAQARAKAGMAVVAWSPAWPRNGRPKAASMERSSE
jgi:hypothetical protein